MDTPKHIVEKFERHNAVRAEIEAITERLQDKVPGMMAALLAAPEEVRRRFAQMESKTLELAIKATEVGIHKAAAFKEASHSNPPDWSGADRALDRALLAADRHVAALRELAGELDALLGGA